MVMNLFQTATMTLQRNGSPIATDLPVQLDVVNIPIDLMVSGNVPVDLYDLYSLGWTSPIPLRSDYFVDQVTGVKYSVYGNPGVYFDHVECRISRYAEGAP